MFDEIHEYRDGKLINTIRRSMIKRKQPLCIYITTMGSVIDPQAPLIEYYCLFSDALEEDKRPAIVTDRLFTLIYELDSKEEIEKPECWVKANPGIGTVLDLDELIAEWERCKPVPGDKSVFLNKQLNFLTDVSDAAYLDFEVLKRNDRVIPEETLLGRSCYGGFDMATREDFAGAVLEFELDDGSLFFLHHSWIPKKKVLENNEKIEYYEWALKGYLTMVDAEYVDQDLVYEWYQEQSKKYQILTIGYDYANATWLVRRLEAAGFKCEEVRQGPVTLNDPDEGPAREVPGRQGCDQQRPFASLVYGQRAAPQRLPGPGQRELDAHQEEPIPQDRRLHGMPGRARGQDTARAGPLRRGAQHYVLQVVTGGVWIDVAFLPQKAQGNADKGQARLGVLLAG